MVILDMGMFPLSLESKLEKLIMRFEKTADLTYNPKDSVLDQLGIRL